jgi:glycosyltransferase involved in cell wall biosynthesis
VISVVVPVLNGCPWLELQLEALSRQRCEEPWEVVVADNGSTDGTQELVDRWTAQCTRIRFVDASARRGPGAARNIGVKEASGNLLAFCDADDQVQPGWLQACVAGLATAEVVAGVFDFGLLSGRPPQPERPAASEQLGFLPAGLGANLAVRRQDFEEMGGFSEDLFVGEDVDLCWRLQLAGRRFAMLDGAIVAKREQQALAEVFRRAMSYGRSGPVLYRRYRERGARRQLRRWVKSIGWLIVSLPLLRERNARGAWVHGAGMRVGRLVGSVENRVFFP